MDSYRKEAILPSFYSEDDSEEERVTFKRKTDESDAESNKRRKIEPQGRYPRLSNVSSVSSLGSSNSSDGELSPAFYGGRETSTEQEEELAASNSNHNQVESNFSSKAQNIMMNMGYQKGKGLGKFGQGITAPISASQQRGRRGLGFIIEGLEPMENLTWDKSKEHISIREEVFWISSDSPLPCVQALVSWAKEGKKKKDISDEIEFCHPKVLQQILLSKTVFDKLSDKELYKARSRCNPFETVGKLFFQNRAALKMANLDAVFDFMFTQPVDENGRSLVLPEELLYFADVCAAPGGFSEYVLWKRKHINNGFCDAKGFGFTLKENDFKLHDFFAAPSEYLEPHYGVNGNTGDGDVYVPTNISNFRNFVLKSTGGKGIHFMMADGGFSVDGNENLQEILSKRLYLCQFLVALGILREGGHFVCKLFDVFTPFSVGLIYIMYKSFKHISLHKPNSSRPANSERYIVCKWRNEDVEDAYEYLYKINLQLDEFWGKSDRDISELVPIDLLKGDEKFYHYVYDSNNVFGERQVVALQKIRAFCQDLSLIEDQQATLRTELLSFWQLPDKSRVAPTRMDPKSKISELISHQMLDRLTKPPVDLTLETVGDKIHSPYDFRFVYLGSPKDGVGERGFFLGLGGPNVYLWSGKDAPVWQRLKVLLNLPADTLIYGELVTELQGELRAQRRVRALHCIDAVILNGFDVSSLHLVERHSYLRKFAAAIHKESRNDLVTIRCKPIHKFEEIEDILKPPMLDWRIMKGGNSKQPRRVYREAEAFEDDSVRYTVPSGILLMKITQDPWMMAFSKSQKKKYWFNTHTRESTFACHKDVIAPVSVSYCQGAFWWWNPGVQILKDEDAHENSLHLQTLLEHIRRTR